MPFDAAFARLRSPFTSAFEISFADEPPRWMLLACLALSFAYEDIEFFAPCRLLDERDFD